MSNIDITTLTPEQLAAVRKQLTELKAERKRNRTAWTDIVDPMLRCREGDGYKHTTADIWTALHGAGLEELNPEETTDKTMRDSVLKRIQARKQKLAKKGEDVGYKTSPRSIMGGSWNFDSVMAWLTDNRDSLTPDQLIALGEFVEQ